MDHLSSLLVAAPLVGALTGYAGPRLLFPLLVRRRAPELVGVVGSAIEKLGSGESAASGEISARIDSVIDRQVERIVCDRIPRVVPMAAMILTPAVSKSVAVAIRPDLRAAAGEALGELGRGIAALSPERAALFVTPFVKSALPNAQRSALILGALIGAIQSALLLLLL